MSSFSHDFAVIGGGSGGLAAAKEAARSGVKVVLFDHVTPSHRGTTWGFAGTCVNVGCIPKKLFHYSSLLGESLHDLKLAGWGDVINSSISANHKWSEMVETVTSYIKKLNFSYRTGARSAGVEYINARARFASPDDENLLEYTLKGEKKTIRAKHILVAVGARPTLPSVKGIEHAITSDDIFFMKKAPGKTLVVGGGYIAMECAGFLTGLGYPTTVCVRSRPLRNFDVDMAGKVHAIMRELGTDFHIGKTPVDLMKKQDIDDSSIEVRFDDGSNETFDTVLIATGRTPATGDLGLPRSASISSAGKLLADSHCLVKGTSSIYAVGDCLEGSPELTPVAIKDGELLARRLFHGEDKVFDKTFIPTTVFTPSEYGSVGLSEEQAISQFGKDAVESFLYEWPSLERAAFHREKPFSRRSNETDVEQGNNCFTKLVVHKTDRQKVIGFHFIGPNAGEVTQGFALAVKLGATKADFDDLIGIHPTDAEALCALSVTKSSGDNFVASGGCGGGKCG